MVPALLKQVILGQCDGDPLTWLRVNMASVWLGLLPPAWHLHVSKQLCFSRNPVLLPLLPAQISHFFSLLQLRKMVRSLFLVQGARCINFLVFSLQTILSMALTLPASRILLVSNLILEFVQREQSLKNFNWEPFMIEETLL